MASLSENIARTVSSLDAIEQSIADHGVDMSEQIAVEEYPSKIGEVYSAGYASGNEEGYSKGYSAGTQNGLPSTWDYFWDGFQMGTTSTEGVKTTKRTDYNFAFSYGWTVDTFKPKYNIIPSGVCMKTFMSSKISGDLVEILSQCNVKLNTSGCTKLTQAFANTLFTRVGEIDLSGAGSAIWGVFYSHPQYFTSYLKTIDKLIVSDKNIFSSTFYGCTALENLTIEGTIGQKGLDLQWSTKLSKASIISIINALSDATSGLTVALSKTAVNNAFGIDVDDLTTWGEGTEYYNLRHSKDNWSISYM